MKIQCNVCETVEANVLCCADEAALCLGCDQKVHAANKLASKHQRVPLSSSSSQMPKCDICQETIGYFFCLEDRALLCRKCDVAIHNANSLVSQHQRFLLTGVKVGAEAIEHGPSSSSGKMGSHSNDKGSQQEFHSVPQENTIVQPSSQYQTGGREEFSSSKLPFAGGSATGSISQWPMDEFLGLVDYNQNFNYMDHGSSKSDSERLGDSDFSPGLSAADGELEGDDCMGQVSDTYWSVPEVPSPPTASGFHWPKYPRNFSDSAASVPDLSSSVVRIHHHHHNHNGLHVNGSKRRRHL